MTKSKPTTPSKPIEPSPAQKLFMEKDKVPSKPWSRHVKQEIEPELQPKTTPNRFTVSGTEV